MNTQPENPARARLGLHKLAGLLLAGLLLPAVALAAPGDVLFSDDFERATLGPDWSVAASGGDAGIGTYTANSGTRSLYTRWGRVSVTSRAIDLSAIPAADLTLWIRRGDDNFSEDPDRGEDFVVEYLDAGGTWRQLTLYTGDGTPGEIFQPTYFLPDDALHAGFRLRFRQLGGSGSNWDYWHVDDVIITERAAGTAPPSSCAGSLFDDDFEYGFLTSRWTVAASGGDAGVGTYTANSGVASLFTRYGRVDVTSRAIDLAGQSNLNLSVWIRRGDDAFSEDPDNNEDLVIEYLASNNAWVTLETFAGNGTPGQIYDRSYLLPANAYHAGFRLRFRQTGGSGIGWDYWHVDDVCIAPYTPPSAFAYYMMDESAWNGTPGEVRDSSGNNRNGTALGAANTNNVDPAIPGNPGTCGYGEIPFNDTVTPQDAVDTGIDMNDVGDRGTISFWYKSNVDWGTRDLQLFDASDDSLGANNPNNKYFFLALQRGTGRLRFALEDTSDRDLRVETGNLGYRAGEWVYITVTWDLPADRMAIYVNGALDESEGVNSNGRLGNVTTLYLGDNRGGYLVSGATANSADGAIDEVRIYDFVLDQAQIQADMNATHPCAALDHFRIEHDGTALTCQPEAVTVRACADPTCATLYADPVSVTLTPTGWVGGDTQSFTGGLGTFELRHTTPGTVTLGISSSTPLPAAATECLNTATGAASCDLTFYDSGFVYSIPTQTSCAVSGPVTIAAVRKDATSQRCVPAFANRTADVNFWTTYVDPATGTRQLTLNNGSADTLLPTASPGTAVPLTFDANGEATVTVQYPDAGRLSLNSQFTGSGAESGLVMTGSADFVTKPARFVVQSPDLNADCASGDATCSVFRAAGDAFNLTVRAACADGTVTPNFVHDSIAIGHNLVAPAGGNPGTIGVTSTAIAAADNGETTIANQSVSEVGVFSFTAQLGTPWLGETTIGDAASNTSPNIGRFVPAWFDVSRVNGCDAGNFTYSGQPFVVTATAYNSAGGITANYDGNLGFAFDATISDAGDTANFTNNVIPAGNFGAGIGTRADVTYTFPAPETAPATVNLRATDSDGVSSLGHQEPATDIHSGRVRLANAFGSELLDLQVPMSVQHYDGSAFVDFPGDICTTTTVSLTRIDGTLSVGTGANPGETCIRDDDGESGSNNCSDASQIPGPVAEQFEEPPVNASFNLWLKAPGQNFTGNVDVNASVDAWLRFDWNGDGTPDDPAARATFGIYRGDDRIIYWRERFD